MKGPELLGIVTVMSISGDRGDSVASGAFVPCGSRKGFMPFRVIKHRGLLADLANRTSRSLSANIRPCTALKKIRMRDGRLSHRHRLVQKADGKSLPEGK